MKYIILILVVIRIVHLLVLHNFYQELNREKIKQYKNNYIAIIIKDLIIVFMFTEFIILISLIYVLLDKIAILCEKVMDIIVEISYKREKLERFIVRKILKLLDKEVKE